MILTCPNCGTQYVVKDGAVPPEGRQVRCAACKHSWHQDPEVRVASGLADSDAQPVEREAESDTVTAPHEGDENENESFAEATLIAPRSGPEAEERAYEEASVEGDPEPSAEQSESSPAEEPVTAEAAAPSDWDEPPTAEGASDTFSPFAEEGEVEPRRGSRRAHDPHNHHFGRRHRHFALVVRAPGAEGEARASHC
jgi:predicted Zn finger-like uncharacterized protein